MMSSTDPTVLQIDGFILRPMQVSDLEVLAILWANPDVTRFLPSRGVPIPREKVEKAIHAFVAHWQQWGYGTWAIAPTLSSDLIGYCGLRYLNELNEVEMLYGLAQTHWGRGIATQAAKATITYGFNVANLDRVIALTLPENQASRRVMEKAGLRYEKQIHVFNLDALCYSIKRAE